MFVSIIVLDSNHLKNIILWHMMEFKRSDLKKLTYFLWKNGMNAPAIEKINFVLGTGTVLARNCQQTIAKFIVGDFVVDDEERSGRPLVNTRRTERVN